MTVKVTSYRCRCCFAIFYIIGEHKETIHCRGCGCINGKSDIIYESEYTVTVLPFDGIDDSIKVEEVKS